MEIPKDWIEAGARALYETDPSFVWDRLTEDQKQAWRNTALPCLAAVFGKAEVVFRTEKESADVQVNVAVTITNKRWVNILPEVALNDRDTLLIVRGC